MPSAEAAGEIPDTPPRAPYCLPPRPPPAPRERPAPAGTRSPSPACAPARNQSWRHWVRNLGTNCHGAGITCLPDAGVQPGVPGRPCQPAVLGDPGSAPTPLSCSPRGNQRVQEAWWGSAGGVPGEQWRCRLPRSTPQAGLRNPGGQVHRAEGPAVTPALPQPLKPSKSLVPFGPHIYTWAMWTGQAEGGDQVQGFFCASCRIPPNAFSLIEMNEPSVPSDREQWLHSAGRTAPDGQVDFPTRAGV